MKVKLYNIGTVNYAVCILATVNQEISGGRNFHVALKYFHCRQSRNYTITLKESQTMVPK